MQKQTGYRIIAILLVILLSACNMPGPSLSSAEQTAIINVSVAQTVAAGAVDSPQAEDPDPAASTGTPGPGTIETNTQLPDTPIGNTSTPSNTPIPCNLGRFVTDVSIPDGTVFEPGEVFTKTWRLKNAGSCAWSSGFDIVFSGGDAMNAPSSVQLTSSTVNPGQNLDVSVILTAPAAAGTYRGNWQLRDPSDVIFGIENSTSGFFWVEIEVIVPTETPASQSATLHRSSFSKSVSVDGASSDTRLGIAPNGSAIRAFIDYDLSSLTGLSTSSTIQSAVFNVSNFTGNSCFEFLHPLKAGVIGYGAIVDYPADFDQVPSANIFAVPTGGEISSPIDITSILQDFVDAEGDGHFQIRMELEHDHAGVPKCMMEWPDPLLVVTYLP